MDSSSSFFGTMIKKAYSKKKQVSRDTKCFLFSPAMVLNPTIYLYAIPVFIVLPLNELIS